MITNSTRHLWNRFRNESLFRNSIYLMLSTAILGLSGFIFWALCSHVYTPAEIGIATSLISISSLIIAFSNFGFGNVLARFLTSSSNKNSRISTAFLITGFASIIFTSIFLVWTVHTKNPIILSPHFNLLVGIFIFYCFITTINTIQDSVFLAYRKTKFTFIKNIIISILKIALLFVIIGIGSLTIVTSITVAIAIALLVGFILLIISSGFEFFWVLDSSFIKETRLFAISNYVGNLFGIIPSSLLPIVILSRLGSSDAAFFYIPTAIISLMNIIPSAISQSLLAETSHDETGLEKNTITATRDLFLLLIPSLIIVWLLGGIVLKFFGAQYFIEGIWPLRILALASVVGSLNYFGDALLNIKKNNTMYIIMNAFNAALIITLGYIAAPYGLVKVSEAVLVGQLGTLIIYIGLNGQFIKTLWKHRFIKKV